MKAAQCEKICVRESRKLNLFVCQHDSDDRPTIFFIHGSMANHLQFEALIESLRNDNNIVAWDSYGCGESDKPRGWEEYSADEHLRDTMAIVEKYKTQSNHLICHSFGTSQGMRLVSGLAKQDQNDVHSSININSLTLLGTAYAIPDGGASLFRLPVFILDWIQPWLTAKFAGIAFHDDCPENIIAESSKQSSKNPMHVCQAFYRQFKWCTPEEIADVTCPVLILQGGGDKLTPVAGAERLNSVLHKSEMHIIEHAGHQVMQEAPHRVLELLLPFLAAACGRA